MDTSSYEQGRRDEQEVAAKALNGAIFGLIAVLIATLLGFVAIVQSDAASAQPAVNTSARAVHVPEMNPVVTLVPNNKAAPPVFIVAAEDCPECEEVTPTTTTDSDQSAMDDAMVGPVLRAPAGCTDYWDKPSHLFTDRRDVFSRVNIAYRKCLPSYDNTNYAFIKVNYIVAAYNVDGVSMSCNTLERYLNGVEYNMRFFQPYRGTEFNPGGFTIQCSETTVGSEVQNYSWEEQPRLYYGPGSGSDRQPMWTVWMKLNRRLDSDISWSKTQDFNPYS